MNSVLVQLTIGLLISTVIGIAAYKRRSLSASGVVGAILTGSAIFGFGGWIPGILLVAFFVSSSLLSKFKAASREKTSAAELFDKGGRRDIWQALANGGAAAGLAVCAMLAQSAGQFELARACYAGMLGALATVTADTWATELGVLSKSQPRLITTFKQVIPGTSGGISLIGTLASLAGSGFIAALHFALSLAFMALTTEGGPNAFVIYLGALGLIFPTLCAGVLGALSDSVMGATLQAQYFSAARNKPTERALESDGAPNQPIGGIRGFNNDWVNFVSSCIGAGASMLLFAFR